MQEETIDIGLVMAGAVSAGAYTAGVIDFLIEALDKWEAMKNNHADVPSHNVRIKVIAGASAGGMTAGLLAKMLYKHFEHYKEPGKKPLGNDLFQAWVEEVSFSELLTTSDLSNDAKSLLNGQMVRRIAEKLIKEDDHFFKSNQKIRNYIDDNLEVYFTLANLRGIPYDVSFQSTASDNHRLLLYRDHINFTVNQTGKLMYGNAGISDQEIVDLYTSSAIATGAFPVGLPSVSIDRFASDYQNRVYDIPNEDHCLEPKSLNPNWNLDANSKFSFQAADGGTFNNEPFNLAFRKLQENKQSQNAVIMIDPFPNFVPYRMAYEQKSDILSISGALMKALLGQARFKVEDLYKAFDTNNHDRFLIAPKRSDEFNLFPIACGYMDGFSGFLDKSFRLHDFQLGRRNCQYFLKKYFRMPYDRTATNHPLFKNWNAKLIEKYLITDNGKEYLPIIPLVNDLYDQPEKLPDYPTYREEDVDQFEPAIKERATDLFVKLKQNISNFWVRLYISFGFMFGKKQIIKQVIEGIKYDLKGGEQAGQKKGLIR